MRQQSASIIRAESAVGHIPTVVQVTMCQCRIASDVQGSSPTHNTSRLPLGRGPHEKGVPRSYSQEKGPEGCEHGTLGVTQPVLLEEEGCFDPIA
jgi:hypothetical protein